MRVLELTATATPYSWWQCIKLLYHVKVNILEESQQGKLRLYRSLLSTVRLSTQALVCFNPDSRCVRFALTILIFLNLMGVAIHSSSPLRVRQIALQNNFEDQQA